MLPLLNAIFCIGLKISLSVNKKKGITVKPDTTVKTMVSHRVLINYDWSWFRYTNKALVPRSLIVILVGAE